MTREEIIEGLKLLEDNMVHFDELQNDKGEWIDVHELLFEVIQTLEQESTYYPPCQDCNKKMDEIRRIYDKIKEQEPCDNAISRSDMLDAIGHGTTYTSEELQRVIQKLPPVNPQPLEGFIDGVHAMGYREGYKDAQKQKSGKWIYEKRKRLINETDEGVEYATDYWCKCSKCGGDFGYIKMKDAFCKYCGAKMESEVNE